MVSHGVTTSNSPNSGLYASRLLKHERRRKKGGAKAAEARLALAATRLPKRHSRHYYDLYKLALSPVRQDALRNLAMLRDVVEFKKRFYPVQWARYELAIPGSLRLVPPDDLLSNLAADYRDMRLMLFGEAASFDDIIVTLQSLEAEINTMRSRAAE